jgi:hypothetical protein
VVVRWGAVEVVTGGSRTRFYWGRGWPDQQEYPCRTVDRARSFMLGKLAKMLGNSKEGGYSKLPVGSKIRTRRT